MRIGIIGGTGIGERLADEMRATRTEHRAVDTPFGQPSDRILLLSLPDAPDLALLPRHGPGHRLPPHRVPYRANVFALKTLGVTHIIATGACGSLSETIRPGQLVLPDQLIDRTDARQRTFFDDLAVHVEFAQPFCPVTRAWLADSARDLDITLHDGASYVVISGPSFSTRAESALHRSMGAHLVGMTALPEARLAREAEIAYALIAIPTDDDCWRPHDPDRSVESLLQEIRNNLRRAGDAAFQLIRAALSRADALRDHPSPAHTALAHAIWTDPAHIDSDTRRRLAPLIGAYTTPSD